MSYRNQPEAIPAAPPSRVRFGTSLETQGRIYTQVYLARYKHPVFARSWWGRFAVLLEEVGELIWAVVWERKPERIRAEALDCIAVLVRIVEGE